MPLPWTVAILAVVAAAVVARVALPGLPIRGAAPLSGTDLTLGSLGVLGLVAHCGAMFWTSVARGIPGTDAYVTAVNGMGLTSSVLYVVPALLVLTGLRRVPFPSLGIIALTFVAVGLTMYDDGPLAVHLTSILVATAALAAIAATQVRRPDPLQP